MVDNIDTLLLISFAYIRSYEKLDFVTPTQRSQIFAETEKQEIFIVYYY